MIALNQFIAEKEVVQILPNFRMNALELASGRVGPFLSGSPSRVPLWLALFLKKQSKCKILIPTWLSVESLAKLVKFEKETEAYQKVHDHYLEIATLLLQYAPDDFEDLSKTRSLLEDIEHLRKEKLRRGLEKSLLPRRTSMNLTDLSSMEISEIKPFLLQSMTTLDQLSSALETETRSRNETEVRTSVTSALGLGTVRKGGRKLTKYS